jgi:WD40 repeat protein
VNGDKFITTDGSNIYLFDTKTLKFEIIVKGEKEDLVKSLSSDSKLIKIVFIKKGKIYLYEILTKKIIDIKLGTDDVGYFKSATISPDGNKIAGIGVNIAGGAPDELWIGEIDKFLKSKSDNEEYNGKRVVTEEFVKEVKWTSDSKFLVALTDRSLLYIDAVSAKIVKTLFN